MLATTFNACQCVTNKFEVNGRCRWQLPVRITVETSLPHCRRLSRCCCSSGQAAEIRARRVMMMLILRDFAPTE